MARKLQIKPGMTVQVVNVPDMVGPFLASELAENPVEFVFNGKTDLLLVFVKNLCDVESIVFPLLSGVLPGTRLWLAYPKGTSGKKTDINRDILWKKLEPEGWGPARMIALDDTWSCMRFSPLNRGT